MAIDVSLQSVIIGKPGTPGFTEVSEAQLATMAPSAYYGKAAMVTYFAGVNPVPVFSNGNDWLRFQDGSVFVPVGANVPVASVSISPSSASLVQGETQQLSAIVLPSDATNKSVGWASSDTSKATVTDTGLVSAVAPGTVSITATTMDGGFSSAAPVTVTQAVVQPTSVVVTPSPLALIVGGTQQMTATVLPVDATDKTITWSSDNTSIATVSSTGLVTSLAAGTANIRATAANAVYGAVSLTSTAPIKLKAVTQWNSILKDIDPTPGTSGYLGYALRLPMRIGGTVVEFDPLFMNCYKKDLNTGLLVNPGFSFQIDGASIEINGVTKPITFGGSRSATLANGEGGLFPDPLPTSAWGLSSVPSGTIVYLQLRGTVPAGGSILYNSMQPAYISNCQSWLYNKTNTTISSVDTPGAMTFSGSGVPDPRLVVYMAPLMLGKHATADAVSVLGDGDSIGAGVGDNQLDNIGYGYINRLVANAGVGGLNLSVGGSRAIDGLNDPRYTNLFQYGTHSIINYGTNNPESASVVVGLIQQRVQMMKAVGVKKALIAYRLPLTNSTDNYVSVANQSVIPSVQAAIVALNSAIEAAGFDGTLKHNSVRDTTDTTNVGKWKAGTVAAPAAYTVDGTHPGAAGGAGNVVNGYTLMYNEDLAQFNALIAA